VISEHKKIARFSVPKNQGFSWHTQKPEVFDRFGLHVNLSAHYLGLF